MSLAAHEPAGTPEARSGVGRTVDRFRPSAWIVLAGDLLALATGLVVVPWGAVLAIHAGAVLVGQWITGAYRFRVNVGGLRDAPHVVVGVAVPMVVVSPLAVMAGVTQELMQAGVVSVVAMVGCRGVAAQVVTVGRRRGRMRDRAVILGSGVVARELATRLAGHERLGLDVVGFLDDGEDPVPMPVPHLGTATEIDDAVRRTGARHVIAAFSHVPEATLVGLLRSTREHDVDVHVVPRFYELGLGTADHCSEDAWGIPLHRLPPPAHRASTRHLKRAFDVVGSGLLLLAAAPLLAAIAVAVRLSSPGPVLFRQPRLGQHGRDFELLKFRSMRVNDDSDITWSVRGDDRVTRVGRFLRDTCLDELPQLWNVLRGDMSLVGPRPERRQFADRFATEVERYADRNRVPAGMTGWAQIHGLRGDTSIAHRAQFDNSYIEDWSLWSDVSILARTVAIVLRGQS